MDLDLQPIEYLQVSVTDRKCMQVLPNTSRRSGQKVVVGDKSGTLQSFGIKRRDVTNTFKTSLGTPINRVVLGGALGTTQDKMFVASQTDVQGFSRKGKKFLDFNTNLTETVTNLAVSGSDLLAGGHYLYNYFSDCIDKGYFLCPDKINDMIIIPTTRTPDDAFYPVLACNDRIIRILESCDLRCELEIPGIPECVVEAPDDELKNPDAEVQLVYGMSDGRIGRVDVISDTQEPVHKPLIDNKKNLAGVSCLAHHDITADGVNELLVGRDDGTVEVYSYDVGEDPTEIFKHCYNESVTAISGGCVGCVGADEIITSTYSGWVAGLTTENQQQRKMAKHVPMLGEHTELLPDNTREQQHLQHALDEDEEKKLQALRGEVEALTQRVRQEREKHMQRTMQAVQENHDTVTRAACFDVNDKFVLNASDASYHLSIEVQTAIESVILQSNVPIDLLDEDRTNAVVSYTSSPPPQANNNNQNFLLVTYRCQANTSRLELKVRSIEGHHGFIQAYVVPRLKPKSCVVRRYAIKPLSLHQRIHNIDDSRPHNKLTLSGPFSIAEVHSWLGSTLPDVPERAPTSDEATLNFASTFLDTQLSCRYRKGEVVFHSDNISTISILKDVMSKEATVRKIQLNISYDLNAEAITHTLHLIHPKLDHQLALAKKTQLIGALEELATSEGSSDFLAPEYKKILKDAETIKSEYSKQPAHLERLYGMITDLFIDMHKFKGVNAKRHVPELLQTLDNYDLETLLAFFNRTDQN